MTFLQYVARKLLGPPVSGGSYWRCPFCDSRRASLSVRPPKDALPIKWKCHRCGEWGDEHDLLRHFRPELSYTGRCELLDSWRLQFGFLSPGMDGDYTGESLLWRLLREKRIDHDDLLEVTAELNHRLNLRREWHVFGRRDQRKQANGSSSKAVPAA